MNRILLHSVPAPTRWILTLAYAAVLSRLLLSVSPWEAMAGPTLAPGITPPDTSDPLHSFFTHTVAFAILGAGLSWCSLGMPWARGAAALGGGLLYGAIAEWLQLWVPNRQPSLADLSANTFGILLGACALWLLANSRTQPDGTRATAKVALSAWHRLAAGGRGLDEFRPADR